MPIAFAWLATFAEHKFLTVFREVRDWLEVDAFITALHFSSLLYGRGIRAINHRARRHPPNNHFAALAGLARATTILAVFGNELGIEMILTKIVRRWVDHQNDIATRATIATVRTPTRHKFLPTPGNNAVATIASLREDPNVINEHAAPSPPARPRSTAMHRDSCIRSPVRLMLPTNSALPHPHAASLLQNERCRQ